MAVRKWSQQYAMMIDYLEMPMFRDRFLLINHEDFEAGDIAILGRIQRYLGVSDSARFRKEYRDMCRRQTRHIENRPNVLSDTEKAEINRADRSAFLRLRDLARTPERGTRCPLKRRRSPARAGD